MFIDQFLLSPDSVLVATFRLGIFPIILDQFEEIQVKIEKLNVGHNNDHVVARKVSL